LLLIEPDNEKNDILVQRKPGLTSPFHYVAYVIDQVKKNNRKRKSGASIRPTGKVGSACLWHACRAITLGSLLVITGITLCVLGQYSESEINEFEPRLKATKNCLQLSADSIQSTIQNKLIFITYKINY